MGRGRTPGRGPGRPVWVCVTLFRYKIIFKMKLLGMTTFSVLVDKNFGNTGSLGRYPRAPTREIGPLHEERYSQLLEMFQFYNPKFDERKYLSYGCNCHVFGNRPMSDPGFGPPVDSLDQSCKAYKDCNKCVKIVHGDTCEKSTYNYTVKGQVHRTRNLETRAGRRSGIVR